MIVTSSVTGIIIPLLFISLRDVNFALTEFKSFLVNLFDVGESVKNRGICSLYFAEFFTATSIPSKAR